MNLIDSTAQEIESGEEWHADFQRMSEFKDTWSDDMLRRGICWQVAQGCVAGWKDFTQSRLIRTVGDSFAFPFMNFQSNSDIAKTKPRYRIAYVIMVHKDFNNVKNLIEAINDPHIFALIHVDRRADPEFYRQVQELIMQYDNMDVIRDRFTVIWAHVSIVWTQLWGFFELLDRIDFEYVINLSGSDYPLKSTSTMLAALDKMPNHNWVWWAPNSNNILYRLVWMWHCRVKNGDPEGLCDFANKVQGQREFQLWDIFPVHRKSSQWVILTKSTIERLRSSKGLRLLLLHMEHSSIPDESLFSLFISGSAKDTPITNRDPKRLMSWNHGPHPHTFSIMDTKTILAEQSAFFFIRKVDTVSDPQLKQLLDSIRQKGQMDRLPVHIYNPDSGIIPID